MEMMFDDRFKYIDKSIKISIIEVLQLQNHGIADRGIYTTEMKVKLYETSANNIETNTIISINRLLHRTWITNCK